MNVVGTSAKRSPANNGKAGTIEHVYLDDAHGPSHLDRKT
jgi:hypothetical protein